MAEQDSKAAQEAKLLLRRELEHVEKTLAQLEAAAKEAVEEEGVAYAVVRAEQATNNKVTTSFDPFQRVESRTSRER
eukprot:5359313-Pyramimonas_sp.AAC.1